MKLKSHYYMAQLLFNEIKGIGYLYMKGVRGALAEGLRDAIVENEESFFAGALGPDIYPDMLVGARIHPGKNVNPALWLAMMYEEFRNNYDYKTQKGKEVLAFITGWMTHCACDIFLSTYINHVLAAASVLPGTKEEKELIRAVESYLDAKIPSPSRILGKMRVKAPVEFLKSFFLDDRRICFNSASSRSEFVTKKEKEESSDKKDTKTKQVQSKDETAPDDIATLDYSEENLDILYLLGGIRRALFYDENAPFEEQEEIGRYDTVKSNRMPYLKQADELINFWINLYETIACKILTAKEDDEAAQDDLLNYVKTQLEEFQNRITTLLAACSGILTSDGIPQWLLEYLLRKNLLNMGELTRNLAGGTGPLKGELSIKITGPLSPVVGQVKKMIGNMAVEVMPGMMKKIVRNLEAVLKNDDPVARLESHWNREKVDSFTEKLGKAMIPIGETFTPLADALTLAQLCMLGNSMDEIIAEVHKASPAYIKWLYDDPKKGKFDLVKPKSFPAATKRLRFIVRFGNREAAQNFRLMCGDDLVTVEKQKNQWCSYILFDKYLPYTGINSVSFEVKTGSPDDKLVIAVEAEDQRVQEKWKELIIIGGSLTSTAECKVTYTGNLPQNVIKAAPKVDHSDGVSYITVPLTYQKQEEKPGEKKEKVKDKFDFDVGALSFIRSLDAGKEWLKLENENPPYYYFLHALMRLTDECYR